MFCGKIAAGNRTKENGMELTTLCYLEQDGYYLMLHRIKKKQDINQGKWIGVGGHFEFQESPEDCVLREVYEETGFSLTSYRYRGLVTFVYNDHEAEYMSLFTADAWTGTQKECEEGELAWVKKEDVFSLRLWEGDRIFLKLLLERESFFSLKLVYEGDDLKEAWLDGIKMTLEKED